MNIEKAIKECELNLEKIKQFDPDPYYTEYFFKFYIDFVIKTYDSIFEEANRDFGLFVSGNCTKIEFEKKAKEKNDEKALEFVSWFNKKYDEEHEAPYPNFVKNCCEYYTNYQKLPKNKVMIRATERYENDVFQEILVKRHNEKLSSKEELQIEIKRQLPVFLEIINHKRKKKNEPKVGEDQVVASAFLDIGDGEMEIAYASEVYMPVMRRFVNDARNKIKEFTTWK